MIDINVNHLIVDINDMIRNKHNYDKITIVFAHAFMEIIDNIENIDETFMFIIGNLKQYMKCSIEFDFYLYIMKHNIRINVSNYMSQMSAILLNSTESLTSISSNVNRDTILIHNVIDNDINISRMKNIFDYFDMNKDGFISPIDVILFLQSNQNNNVITYLPYINTISNLIFNSYKKIELHEFVYYFDY